VKTPSDRQIQDTLLQYKFSPDPGQLKAIKAYISLLIRWNQKISLTTVVDPLEILRFHFGESIFAASSVPIEEGRLADVGSGAGFPGLALRIALPELSLTLIESNSKKASFLAEASRELNLKRVDIVRQRMEEVPVELGQFDYITARAVGRHENLLAWSRSRVRTTGKIVLWLGEVETRRISTDPSWNWREPIHLPASKRRFILVGSLV
jgi:16S rRNA (guanine527-N7)-methyltransferase